MSRGPPARTAQPSGQGYGPGDQGQSGFLLLGVVDDTTLVSEFFFFFFFFGLCCR